MKRLYWSMAAAAGVDLLMVLVGWPEPWWSQEVVLFALLSCAWQAGYYYEAAKWWKGLASTLSNDQPDGPPG